MLKEKDKEEECWGQTPLKKYGAEIDVRKYIESVGEFYK